MRSSRVAVWALGSLGVAVLAVVPGCGPHTETKAEAKSVPRAVITVGLVESRSVVRTVEMVGTLKGWEEVTIGAKRMGRVVKVLHDMGDLVKPGDVLVQLDPVDAKLAIQQAESKYLAELVKLGITRESAETFFAKFGVTEQILRGDEADKLILQVPTIVQARVQFEKTKLDVNRMRQLLQRGAGSPQELQDLENARDAASAAYDSTVLVARTTIANALSNRVALDQAEQALKDMEVRVPRPTNVPSGGGDEVQYALTKRAVAEGQMVREGEVVAEVVIEDPLRLWGNVPERFSAEVQKGQEVAIRVAAYDRPFAGRVARINPSVDPVSRTFQVEVAVPNDEGLLHPGGFAKASIVTQRDDKALVVPREAIERFAGVTKVFVVKDPTGPSPTAHPVGVTLGLEETRSYEVKGDLQAGQSVAISNLGQLAEGTVVTIRAPEEESSPDAAAEAPKKAAEPPAKADAH